MALIHTLSLSAAESAAYRFAGKAEAEKKLPDHFATILSLTGRSLILTAALLVLVAVTLGHLPAYLVILPWIALLLPVNTVIQTAMEAHRAQQNVGRYAWVETTRMLISFILGALIAWKTGWGAARPFIGMAVVSLFLALREGKWLLDQARSGQATPAARRTYLAFGIPIAAALVLDILLSAADRFLLAYFLGEASVGEYTAGYGVADKTVLLICAWAAMAGAPLVMAAYEEKGADAAADEAQGLIRTILLLGVPAAAGLALVARPLAEAMIGEGVRAGAMQIIPWIAFAGLLNGLTIHYATEAFHLSHRTRQLALLMLVPAIGNIALNLVLIPLYGLMGAVGATLLSYVLGLVVLLGAGRQHIALPLPLVELAKVAIAALAMWPAIAVLPDWGSWPELFLKAFIGGLVYISVAIFLDAADARSFIMDKVGSRNDDET